MSTALTWQITSTSSDETEQIGERLGARLRGGEVIELVSDLGGGKTTLVRGIARGLGSSDRVASPTFTLSREYHASKLALYHFDFYRLNDAGILMDELAEIVGDARKVVVVEWGELVHDVLPPGRLTITIQATGERERQLVFKYPPELTNLIDR